MIIKQLVFPANNGLEMQYDLTVDDGYEFSLTGARVSVGAEIVEPADTSGTLSDGDCVWITPSGFVHVASITDENGEITQGEKPAERFENGECYWVLTRSGSNVFRLEVA